MNAPTLRPYQARALEALRDTLRGGVRRMLLVSPTGSGKTHLFSEILRSFRERSRQPAIVIVHRRELVTQSLEKLAAVGIGAGVIMGDDPRARASDVQVCSIQTLHRRLRKGIPPAGLVIYDEAHHAASRSSREVLAAYPDAILIGFTATPWRTDKQGLGDLFKALIVAATPGQLIEAGALVPCEPYAYDAPDLHEVPIVAGEFKRDELEAACNTEVLVGSVVREYVQHANGRRAIVFPVGCEHSRSLVAEFHSAGISAAHIDWATPATERAAAIEAFREGRLLILSSVGVLTEGFDAPAAEVCILARPTKSLSLFIQMAGRVLRPSPGKTRALLHDHGGNLFRFGFPEDDREYTLAETPPRTRDVMVCTDCGYAAERWKPDGTCPRCGSIQALPAEVREASDRRRGKEQVEGRRIGRDELTRILEAAKKRGRELTRAQAVKLARATPEEKAAEFLRLRKVREQKNLKPGFPNMEFRKLFGHWPQFSEEELSRVEPADRPFLPLPPRPAPEPEKRDPSTIRPAVRG
jgi:DNA repair protein RadD